MCLGIEDDIEMELVAPTLGLAAASCCSTWEAAVARREMELGLLCGELWVEGLREELEDGMEVEV